MERVSKAFETSYPKKYVVQHHQHLLEVTRLNCIQDGPFWSCSRMRIEKAIVIP